MGSFYSTVCNRFVANELPSTSLLFSDFCGSIKQNNHGSGLHLHKQKRTLKFSQECEAETIETIVHLWCIKCLSATRWQNISHRLKNKLIHDFLNTLYCTSHSFDEIFLLLFTNSKSRSFILGNRDRLLSSSEGLRDIVEDILRYSLFASLKFSTYNSSGQKCLETIVDFPLKTFSLCPCTRRPLYVAMYLGRPDIVHLLLKHGARIPYEDVCNCMQDSRHPLKNVMDILKVTCDSNSEADPSKSVMNRTERNALSLKLILTDIDHSTTLWMNVCEILQNLTGIEENYVPSLKHISRTRIRHTMRSNPLFCHPHIWKILNLPQTLISYVNLDDFNDTMCQF